MKLKWEEFRKNQKEKKEEKRYVENFGEDGLKNRAFVERILERMEKEDERLYKELGDVNFDNKEVMFGYNWRLRRRLTDEMCDVSTVFPVYETRFESLKKAGVPIEKYEWTLRANFREDELDNWIEFQDYMWDLLTQNLNYEEMVLEMKNNGMDVSEQPGLRKIEELMQQTLHKLEMLLNPVTRKFNDQTSKEEELTKRLNMKVQKLMEMSAQPRLQSGVMPVSNQAPQLESIKQLQSVLENEFISEKIKDKAKNTIQEIEEGIALEEQRRKKEEAELEANAILEASFLVHKLKGENSNGVY